MSAIGRKIVYFSNAGPQNSEKVIEAVKERIANGDIGTVVVASTSGETGARFAKDLKGTNVHVIAVSHEKMTPEYRRKITEYKGKAFDKTHIPFDAKGMDDVRKSFYALGQGFKVAVEVILIASDKGAVKPYENVIGIGGTGNGADTAIIARATKSKEIFTEDNTKRLEIREIIAMPLKKHWW